MSGIRFGGIAQELIALGIDDAVDIAYSQSILDETLRVLRNKFRYTPDQLTAAENVVKACARRVEPAMKLDIVKDDPNDNHVIECAVAAGAKAVITGDNHLLRLEEYQEIRMPRLTDFLKSRGQETSYRRLRFRSRLFNKHMEQVLQHPSQ